MDQQPIIPCEYKITQFGTLYQFNFEAIMRHLLKSHNLEKYAKEEGMGEPVMWAFTLDSAKITNNLQHLLAGCKIVDKGQWIQLQICLCF